MEKKTIITQPLLLAALKMKNIIPIITKKGEEKSKNFIKPINQKT